MGKEHVSDNMDIIKKAYDILKKGYAFHNSTLCIQMSYFKGLSEEGAVFALRGMFPRGLSRLYRKNACDNE